MKKYIFDDYTMILRATDRRDNYDHVMVSYTFKTPKGKMLFKRNDLGASPLHAPESLESAKALLSFLTLRKGDADDEYFDNYTKKQLEFSESMDCENLQLYAMED